MTAVTTPRAGGIRHRRAIIGVLIVATLVAIALMVWSNTSSGSSRSTRALTCKSAPGTVWNSQERIEKIRESKDLSYNEKRSKIVTLRKEQDAAKKKAASDECLKEISTISSTAVPGAPNAPPQGGCDGGIFSPYQVPGTQRFGAAPVDLANPGSPQDVANSFVAQFHTNRWLSAAWSQGSYLVDGGISTVEVQAKAQSFVTDPAGWEATSMQLGGIMSRATFSLERSSAAYATQEAEIGANPCVAPAAHDVGFASRGERLLLHMQLAPADGGRLVTVVVDCDGQIHLVGTPPVASAPPATPVTQPPRTPAPPRTTVPNTQPPRTTAPPRTTQPPRTTVPTTAPPRTTLPLKQCGGAGQPSCTGVGSE